MCDFFSCLSDGKGNIFYFDAKMRKKIYKGKVRDWEGRKISEPDSHSSIAAYFKLNEDKMNKWEYIGVDLLADTINADYDEKMVRTEIQKLDFKKIRPKNEYGPWWEKIINFIKNIKFPIKAGSYAIHKKSGNIYKIINFDKSDNTYKAYAKDNDPDNYDWYNYNSMRRLYPWEYINIENKKYVGNPSDLNVDYKLRQAGFEKFKKGEKYVIKSNTHSHYFDNGTVVQIIEVRDWCKDFKAASKDNEWYVNPYDLRPFNWFEKLFTGKC